MTTPIEILNNLQKEYITLAESTQDDEKRNFYYKQSDALGIGIVRIEKEYGWISTSIELPPEDTNVMIWEGGQSNLSGWNEPKIGWYNKKFGFQSETDYHIVTHWMPLPTPPNQ